MYFVCIATVYVFDKLSQVQLTVMVLVVHAGQKSVFFSKFIHFIESVIWIYDTFDNKLGNRNVGSVLINISLSNISPP